MYIKISIRVLMAVIIIRSSLLAYFSYKFLNFGVGKCPNHTYIDFPFRRN